MEYRADVSFESFGGKLASMMAIVKDSDSVTRHALTSERTVVQRLVLRGRLGRNDGEVSTSEDAVWASELLVRAKKSEVKFLSPLGVPSSASRVDDRAEGQGFPRLVEPRSFVQVG
jgi:hypothetical protein